MFAFGLVAHELLVGRLPLSTPPVLLALVAQDLPPVPPLEVDGVSPRVLELLRTCLSESAADRPRTRDLADALDAV